VHVETQRCGVSAEMRIAFGLLALALLYTLNGCQPSERPARLSAEQARRVEVLIRSQYDIPPDYGLTLGRASRSALPGYYDLPVTFSHKGKHVDFNFLLSRDGKRLARLQESDLTSDPWRSIHTAPHQTRDEPDSKVTIVVFDDLACVFCARLYSQIFPGTLDRYKGLVRIAYKE